MRLDLRMCKGQVFFKYLWLHELYQTQGGVSPILSRDLKAIAVKSGGVEPDKNLNNQDVFNWINGSVIPKWARFSAFTLSIRLGWKPVDRNDVLSVLSIDTARFKKEPIETLAIDLMAIYQISFPPPVLKRVIQEVKKARSI